METWRRRYLGLETNGCIDVVDETDDFDFADDAVIKAVTGLDQARLTHAG